jgi:hypothetical protein
LDVGPRGIGRYRYTPCMDADGAMRSNRRGRGNAANVARGIGVTKLKAETRRCRGDRHADSPHRHPRGERNAASNSDDLRRAERVSTTLCLGLLTQGLQESGRWFAGVEVRPKLAEAYRHASQVCDTGRASALRLYPSRYMGSTQITLSLWLVGPFEGGR